MKKQYFTVADFFDANDFFNAHTGKNGYPWALEFIHL